MAKTRKRILKRLKDRFLISITPIPKVRIKVTFRKDGSWHWDFGYVSHDYLVSTGQFWDENGQLKYKGKHCFSGGQDYVINQMWRYIQEQAYYDNIHEMDLV